MRNDRWWITWNVCNGRNLRSVTHQPGIHIGRKRRLSGSISTRHGLQWRTDQKNISEDLADIYQDIKDFIFVFQLGLNETMNDSLAICQENFGLLWGQKLVNTMRALHDVKYSPKAREKTKRKKSTNPKTMKTVTVKMTTAIVTIMAAIAMMMNKRIWF